MKNSKIEWTDHTWNPWIGCSKVSPGCANCYAEALMDLRMGRAKWGPGQPRSRTSATYWREPLKWDREASEKAQLFSGMPWFRHPAQPRPRVFCASLADWLDDEVPIEWLADLLDLIRRTPHLDWLLLTKRPHNWRSRILGAAACATMSIRDELRSGLLRWVNNEMPPANVWVGTSVEDQTRADERIPLLLEIPAAVRFLSMEPLLGGVDLGRWLICAACADEGCTSPRPVDLAVLRHCGNPRIHWVICGGESGPHARPMHPDWARSIRDQCKAAGVAFHFKQWGEHNHDHVRVGKHAAGRLLDGVEHNGFPGGAS